MDAVETVKTIQYIFRHLKWSVWDYSTCNTNDGWIWLTAPTSWSNDCVCDWQNKLLFYKVLLLLLVTLVLLYDPVSGMNSHTVFMPCPSLSVYVKMEVLSYHKRSTSPPCLAMAALTRFANCTASSPSCWADKHKYNSGKQAVINNQQHFCWNLVILSYWRRSGWQHL